MRQKINRLASKALCSDFNASAILKQKNFSLTYDHGQETKCEIMPSVLPLWSCELILRAFIVEAIQVCLNPWDG